MSLFSAHVRALLIGYAPLKIVAINFHPSPVIVHSAAIASGSNIFHTLGEEVDGWL